MKAIDLFSGCGGLSRGFEDAGITVVAAFEKWNIAADCYEANFPKHSMIRQDLSDTVAAIGKIREKTKECGSVDMIIGGPPCQDFSHAGKRVEGIRASLTTAFAEIVAAIKPPYFVMENVDRIESSAAFGEAREIFKKAGYGITTIVLDACHCGVPQKRKRFFCVGALGWCDGEAEKALKSNLSTKEMTMRDYFGNTLGFEFYYRHPRNYTRRAVYSIDEPAATVRGVNRPVPKGYHGHPNDACPLNPTIRALTQMERSLVQTFPVNWKWTGCKTEMEQMIGNAVPVKLAEYVAKSFLTIIGEKKDPERNKSEFKSWLIVQGYSGKSLSDIVSRIKRVDAIKPMRDASDTYLYELQGTSKFKLLTATVRSQLKRSVKLYMSFLAGLPCPKRVTMDVKVSRIV